MRVGLLKASGDNFCSFWPWYWALQKAVAALQVSTTLVARSVSSLVPRSPSLSAHGLRTGRRRCETFRFNSTDHSHRVQLCKQLQLVPRHSSTGQKLVECDCVVQNRGCGGSNLFDEKRLAEEVPCTSFFFASFSYMYLSSLDLHLQHQCKSGHSTAFEIALLHQQLARSGRRER